VSEDNSLPGGYEEDYQRTKACRDELKRITASREDTGRTVRRNRPGGRHREDCQRTLACWDECQDNNLPEEHG